MNSKILPLLSDNCIITMMEEVMDICKSIHTVCAKKDIRIRQPLASFTLVDPKGRYSYLSVFSELVQTIKDECNVKEIILSTEQYKVIL